MAKNRFAQLQYGKVIYIFETDLKKSQLSTIFEPSTFWVDVTGQKCEEGWIAEFKEGIGVVFSKPPNLTLTLEEEKDAKIAEFKKLRDERGVAKITYKDTTFDYDDVSREKMRERRQYLEDNNIEELADITEVIYGILNSMNMSVQELEEVRKNKANKKGAFNQKIYLEEAE